MYESKHVYKWIEKFLTDRTNMFDESLSDYVSISRIQNQSMIASMSSLKKITRLLFLRAEEKSISCDSAFLFKEAVRS